MILSMTIAIRVRALIRIWANQGMPAIPVWAKKNYPYAYGKNTCMGRNKSIIKESKYSNKAVTYPYTMPMV